MRTLLSRNNLRKVAFVLLALTPFILHISGCGETTRQGAEGLVGLQGDEDEYVREKGLGDVSRPVPESIKPVPAEILRSSRTELDTKDAELAEEKGLLREALKYYISALGGVSEGSTDDTRLREKIIKLVHRLDPKPAVSEEAERYMAYGQIAVKKAQSLAGYEKAAKEFQKAVNIAPWWADAYYNLGIVQGKAYQYETAIRNLDLYLFAKPDAPDYREVKLKKYEWEYEMKNPDPQELAGMWYEEFINLSTGHTFKSEKAFFRIQVENNKVLMACLTGSYKVIKSTQKVVPLVELTIQGDKLSGKAIIIPGFRSSVASDRCSGGSYETQVEVTGTVSRDKQTITLRFKRPVVDERCTIVYEVAQIILTRKR